MTSGEEKAKRRWWRPRFSLRKLAVLVTLICAYFAAWEATKKYGVRDVVGQTNGHIERADAPVPFIVTIDPNGGGPEGHYWFFGYTSPVKPRH